MDRSANAESGKSAKPVSRKLEAEKRLSKKERRSLRRKAERVRRMNDNLTEDASVAGSKAGQWKGTLWETEAAEAANKAAIREITGSKAATVTSGKGSTGVVTNAYGSYAGSSYVHKKFCGHKGDTLVFEKNGTQLYGATGKSLNPFGVKLVIDCASAYSPEPDRFVKSGPEKWLKLNAFTLPTPETVKVDWPDGDMPNVGFQFWHEAWKVLPQGKVVVCCFGGHGRTGTALAALMIAQGMPLLEAVETVREIHCSEAIETQIQIDYLTAIARPLLALYEAENPETVSTSPEIPVAEGVATEKGE